MIRLLCTRCRGDRCDDCNHTGKYEIQREVEHRTIKKLLARLVEWGIIAPRDLDSTGRWAH